MDRQDIDALLIGALYGELTPAEEARLTAHLESHPTDRGALDDLKVTRQTFLDSRLFAVQLDPPQAVSALLLQEAHRRAPKAVKPTEEREGWFARFAKNFMAHPAMAAAAMLVLVMGGAGIVWMKKGDSQFAEQNVSQDRAAMTPTANNAPGAMPAPQGATDTAMAGSAMGADLADQQAQGELALAADGKAMDEGASERRRDDGEGQKQKIATGRMEVNTDRAPKDLEEEKAKKEDSAGDDYIADGRSKAGVKKPAAKGGASADPAPAGPARAGAGGGGAGDLAFGGEANANAVSGAGAAAPAPTATPTTGSSAGSGYAQPSPPPPPPKNAKVATTATKPADKSAPATGGKIAAPEKKEPPKSVAKTTAAPKPEAPPTTTAAPKTDAKDSSLIAWAKGEHTRAVALARNGDCAGAAKIAVSVSNRASSYYTQFMATDRNLKGCQTHIANERDKDAEKSQKARAQKRTNADEPAMPSESVK